MEKKEIKEKIRENLEWEKSLKRDGIGEMFIAALATLVALLIVVVICSIFGIELFNFTYKKVFVFVVSCIILTIMAIVILATRKKSVSERKIRKYATHLLERVIFFKNQGKLETCYKILTNEDYVRTPEKLDQVIAELEEMLQEVPSIEELEANTMKNSRRDIHDRAEARKKNQ